MENQPAAASTSPVQALERSLHELRAQCRQLRLLAVAAVIGVILLGTAALAERLAGERLIRTRGLVIEDEAGRDRILIGAPVPPSDDRVRTDVARAEAAWGAQLGGDKFREIYATLDHAANGIVVLNEQGFDTLAIGDRMPDPNTGKRLVVPTGITWNDERGCELGGLGCSKTADGKYRVVMGMDDPIVGEALHLFVLEDGTKGLRIASEDTLLLVGRARAGNEIFGNATEFAGLMVKDASGRVVLEQNALAK